jgi:hypothetical protein
MVCLYVGANIYGFKSRSSNALSGRSQLVTSLSWHEALLYKLPYRTCYPVYSSVVDRHCVDADPSGSDPDFWHNKVEPHPDPTRSFTHV